MQNHPKYRTAAALEVFASRGGYGRLQELRAAGVHTNTLRELLDAGRIRKLKPGLYRLAELPPHPWREALDLCSALPRAVLCLHTALAYHELLPSPPPALQAALERRDKPARLFMPEVRIFFFSPANHHTAVERIPIAGAELRVYSAEKSLVDSFRYRHRLGLDPALRALRTYMAREERDLERLLQSARSGRLFQVMKPYIELLLQD